MEHMENEYKLLVRWSIVTALCWAVYWSIVSAFPPSMVLPGVFISRGWDFWILPVVTCALLFAWRQETFSVLSTMCVGGAFFGLVTVVFQSFSLEGWDNYSLLQAAAFFAMGVSLLVIAITAPKENPQSNTHCSCPPSFLEAVVYLMQVCGYFALGAGAIWGLYGGIVLGLFAGLFTAILIAPAALFYSLGTLSCVVLALAIIYSIPYGLWLALRALVRPRQTALTLWRVVIRSPFLSVLWFGRFFVANLAELARSKNIVAWLTAKD
jgi:hypothetical protein